MIKTQGKSSITISKLAFLDEMLPEPFLKPDRNDWDGEISFSLENTDKLLELVKKLAAKVLTEEELVNILGDCHGYGRNGISYTPNSKEIPH
jgi:hypothetical protein